MNRARAFFLLRHAGIALLGPLSLLAVGFALFFLLHAVTWRGCGAGLALGIIVVNLFLLLSLLAVCRFLWQFNTGSGALTSCYLM